MTLKINKSLAINAGTAKTTGRIIVLHSTDDMEATAKQMATYEHRVWRTAETFVHFGVDDKDIYQVGTPGYKAWGAGNVNRLAPVQIELCEFADKARALKAYKCWIELAVSMAKAYDVPLTLDDGNLTAGFKSHLWCSQEYGGSDHGDPYPYLKTLGISKAQLAADLKTGHASATVSTSTKPTYNTALNLSVDGRWGAATTRKLQATYEAYVDGVIDSQYPWPALTANMTSVTWDKASPTGSKLVKAMQKALGVKADGLLGPDTIKAMQRKAGLIVDGKLSTVSPLVKWMQKKLNSGQKPF